jgi:hypothetical protein
MKKATAWKTRKEEELNKYRDRNWRKRKRYNEMLK